MQLERPKGATVAVLVQANEKPGPISILIASSRIRTTGTETSLIVYWLLIIEMQSEKYHPFCLQTDFLFRSASGIARTLGRH